MEQDVARTSEAFPPMDKGPIEQVREGMKVFDSAGEEIGKVELVRMGDPQAVTTEGQEFDQRDDLIEAFAEAFGAGTDVPPAVAARLMRVGFIRVDGKGWIDTDRLVAADKIANVSGEGVRLSVTKDNLAQD